MNNSHI